MKVTTGASLLMSFIVTVTYISFSAAFDINFRDYIDVLILFSLLSIAIRDNV